MSILDTEEIFPTPNFWKAQGFFHMKNRAMWCWIGTMFLHYDQMKLGGTHYGNVRIEATYHEFSKLFEVEVHNPRVFVLPIPGEMVRFDPIELNNPTQSEIEMVMSPKFLSTRIKDERL